MKLWKIMRTTRCGWDEYDSAVVAAKNEADAREIHPNGRDRWIHNDISGKFNWGHKRQNGGLEFEPEYGKTWVPPAKVIVELIGTAIKGTEAGVICASFNAG